jgi:hypothetical protein
MRLRLMTLLVLLTGCGANSAAAPPMATLATSPPVGAVDFPVTADPRPIVLLGSPLVVVSGYQSDKEKMSAAGGRFAFTGAPPATPEPGPVELPGGTAVLPLVGVREAVTAMSEQGTGEDVLELATAEFSTEVFRTDRGGLVLPAWRFTTAAGSVLAWPAVEPSAFWRFGEHQPSIHSATTADGQALEVTLPAPPPPCEGEEPVVYEPVVTEGDVSVTIGLRTVSGGGAGRGCVQNDMYRMETYPVRLERPLGARLLLDEQQAVMPVETR